MRSQQKGDPGLPGAGRPKKLPSLDVLLAQVLGTSDPDEAAKSEARTILEELVKSAKSGNVQAQIAVLDRAYGKPKQQIEAKVEVEKVKYTLPDGTQIEM